MARRALAAIALAALVAGGAAAGEVSGEVRLGVEGVALAELGPTVVFLAPAGSLPDLPAPKPAPTLRQHNSQFDPSFLVVVEGQTVRFANDDTIFHNVFSFSRPNDFDLGIYPAGQSRSVRFGHAGVVKVYCSIHETMNATVLVAPTALFALASADGSYTVRDVPPGRYALTVWNERLPAVEREVEVGAGRVRLDALLAGPTP